MKLVSFTDEERYIKDFLKLPEMLYGAHDNMEEPDSIRDLLLGAHPLSKYFTLDKYLVYGDDGKVKGRFALTVYKGDDVCYFGFFECVNDNEAAKFLIDSAASAAREKGFTKITGPVDASFWIKYRLKINKFDRPYTGEPYNREYYYDLLSSNGFRVTEHYTSNVFHPIDDTYVNSKFEERYNDFISKGYEIRSPEEEKLDQALDAVCDMVSELYSHFPVFKHVERADFKEIFSHYLLMIDKDMTKLAYYEGKPVGFYISFPDYGNCVYHIHNPLNLIKFFRTKKNPKKYVMLYMGVRPEHRGLGKAMSYAVMKELRKNRRPSISALIRDGNINQDYAREDVTDVYEYVLMERDV